MRIRRLPTGVVCSLAFALAGVGQVCGGHWPQEGAGEVQEKAAKEVAQDPEPTIEVVVADGRLDFRAPKVWEQKKPRFNIVEAEFEAKSSKPDTTAARLTIMASGGSIEQNLERWVGQFSQEDGSNTEDHTKQKEEKVNGMKVFLVDITGTYADSAGPFAGNATQRKGYRMLGAIVETKVAGNYYFKMYGPQATMDEHEKRFLEMVKSVKLSL
jgi:hypothetical protein